jgi:hypothetical protein
MKDKIYRDKMLFEQDYVFNLFGYGDFDQKDRDIVLGIFYLFSKHHFYPESLETLELICQVYSDGLFSIVEKNGKIVYVLQYQVYGKQTFELYQRTNSFIPKLDQSLGENLYIANVVSLLKSFETFSHTRKCIKSIIKKYPNIKYVSCNLTSKGGEYRRILLKRGNENG